jgi:copper(I)-binding protein
MKNRIAALAALSLAGLGMIACEQEVTVEDLPSNEAEVEDGVTDVRVTDQRLVLPAVAGNPGVAYFDITNETGDGIAIVAVDIAGAARAELHQTEMVGDEMRMGAIDRYVVSSAETVSFEPGGLHVMVYELADSVRSGETTEITLTFGNGDKHSFPVPIQAAGADR